MSHLRVRRRRRNRKETQRFHLKLKLPKQPLWGSECQNPLRGLQLRYASNGVWRHRRLNRKIHCTFLFQENTLFLQRAKYRFGSSIASAREPTKLGTLSLPAWRSLWWWMG